MSRITDAVDGAEALEHEAPPYVRVGGSSEWDDSLLSGGAAKDAGGDPSAYLPLGKPGEVHPSAFFYRGHECIGPTHIAGALRLLEEFGLSDLPEPRAIALVRAAVEFEDWAGDLDDALDSLEKAAKPEERWSEARSTGAAVLDRIGGGAVWTGANEQAVLVRTAGTVAFAASTTHPLETLVRYVDFGDSSVGACRKES